MSRKASLMFVTLLVTSDVDLPRQECAAKCELLDGMFSFQLLVFCFLTFQNGQMTYYFLIVFFHAFNGVRRGS
jgi:hypothetical protein